MEVDVVGFVAEIGWALLILMLILGGAFLLLTLVFTFIETVILFAYALVSGKDMSRKSRVGVIIGIPAIWTAIIAIGYQVWS